MFKEVPSKVNFPEMEEKIRRRLRMRPHRVNELKQFTNANRYGIWMFDMALRNLRDHREVVKVGKLIKINE